MSATGLEVFDKTLQTTHIWLDEIMERLGEESKPVAWHVLGAVLRVVRDRVPIELAAHLGAQLPLLVRGLYYDQFRPANLPETWRSADEFFALVAEGLRGTKPIDPAKAAGAVFHVLNHYVEPGQVGHVRASLPHDVRRLWPEGGP